MTGQEMHDRRWIDPSSSIDISCVEIDGRDKWVAKNSTGLIAMADTRESLRSVLRRMVMRGHASRPQHPWTP